MNQFPDKFPRVCLALLSVFIFACGLALVTVSFLPFNEIKPLVDSFAPDGNFEAFTVDSLRSLRLTGIILCIAGILLYKGRNKLLFFISGIQKTDFLIKPRLIAALVLNYFKEMKGALKKEDKIHKYTLIFIILLAAVVRISYLSQPLMADESRIFAKHVYHVTDRVQGISSLITRYDEPGHHIFYTLMEYFTYMFLGSKQWVWMIRLPALLAGILIVPASYIIIRSLYNKNAALLTSGIVASSSPLIFFSANGRGYTTVCLIFLLLLALGTRIKNSTDLPGWHLFAILSAIGAYTITQMLYPYGIAVTWLALSIIFNGRGHNREDLLRNLFVSITITGFLTFLFYSPVIFFGTGLKSIIGHQNIIDATFSLKEMPGQLYNIYSDVFWKLWNRSIPAGIQYILAAGAVCSLIFHKKLSTHRVSVVLAAVVFLITIFLLQRLACWLLRCWLFLLPFYFGLASAGLVYLFKPLGPVFGKYKNAVFVLCIITLSFVLTGNKVRSEPYLNEVEMKEVDASGEHIDFKYIKIALRLHIDEVSNHKARVLVLFPSESKNAFWRNRLHYYFRKIRTWDDESQDWNAVGAEYLIYDLDTYLSDDSETCHYLFVISSEPAHVVKTLLADKGISMSDYSDFQLIHRFKYADTYRMRRTTDCSKASY